MALGGGICGSMNERSSAGAGEMAPARNYLWIDDGSYHTTRLKQERLLPASFDRQVATLSSSTKACWEKQPQCRALVWLRDWQEKRGCVHGNISEPNPDRLSPLRVSEALHRSVIQAIEPEAECVLRAAGGQILRHYEGYVYEEYASFGFPTIVLYWPQGTRFVYMRQAGQEDRCMIFIAVLLPDSRHELHLMYDYRFSCPFGPLEEFFTLRVAKASVFEHISWHCT